MITYLNTCEVFNMLLTEETTQDTHSKHIGKKFKLIIYNKLAKIFSKVTINGKITALYSHYLRS